MSAVRIRRVLPATAKLAASSLLLAIILALPLGMLAARFHGKVHDKLAMTFSLLGVSIPNFWPGLMLFLLVMAANIAGDALRDYLDVCSRR